MNQVILVGRLCADPEITQDQEKKRSVITLAVNRSFKNVDGVYETDFIRCVLWNNVAMNTFSYCHTGDVVGIKGRLQTRSYEDEAKTRKFVMEVIAEKVTFLSSQKNTENSSQE